MRLGHKEPYCKQGHEFTLENTYTISRGRKGGTFRRCRVCAAEKRRSPEMRSYMKRYQVALKYGLMKEQVSELLVSQDGLCAICFKRPAVDVDHDHETGRIRGMLCHGCNLGLAALGDNEEAIRWVLEYVSTPRLEEVV